MTGERGTAREGERFFFSFFWRGTKRALIVEDLLKFMTGSQATTARSANSSIECLGYILQTKILHWHDSVR